MSKGNTKKEGKIPRHEKKGEVHHNHHENGPEHGSEEHSHSRKCQHCGRKLTKDERYCFFCEMEISDDK